MRSKQIQYTPPKPAPAKPAPPKPAGFFSPRTMIDERLAVCRVCPRLKRGTQRCSVCGCFVHLKAKLSSQHCPEGKW